MRCESYSSTESTGKLIISLPLKDDVDFTNKNGLTLQGVVAHCIEHKAKREDIKIVCLIDKPFGRLKEAPKVDYIGFTMKKKVFIIGYGTDFNQSYRGPGYVGAAKKQYMV